jgi:hypothetical protein
MNISSITVSAADGETGGYYAKNAMKHLGAE